MELLTGLDGQVLDHGLLAQSLDLLHPSEAPHIVSSVTLVEGTENRFPTSHSGVISLRISDCRPDHPAEARTIFLKKVSAVAMGHKAWPDRRRTLSYARTELRFYEEFAPSLAMRGVSIPRLVMSDNRLTVLGDAQISEPPGDEPTAEALVECGALLFLEHVVGFSQASPISERQAVAALTAVSRLHAAGMEQRELLTAAATRLQRHGGAFSLSIRNPKELLSLCDHWARFVEVFTPQDRVLFADPLVRALGERLVAASAWVAKELSPAADVAYATLIHGDLKAMNVFLRDMGEAEAGAGAGAGAGFEVEASGSQHQAMLIDFASTGVGFGMADVAMLLAHSVAPADLADGGEERLITAYLAALEQSLNRQGGGVLGGDGGDGTIVPLLASVPYPRDLAMRHYRLAVVDYGRFVVARFWGNASPEAFAAKAANPNTTLVNRDVEAALAFVRRVDGCLRELELEKLEAEERQEAKQ